MHPGLGRRGLPGKHSMGPAAPLRAAYALIPLHTHTLPPLHPCSFYTHTHTHTHWAQEFMVRNTYIYPPHPSMRIIGAAGWGGARSGGERCGGAEM